MIICTLLALQKLEAQLRDVAYGTRQYRIPPPDEDVRALSLSLSLALSLSLSLSTLPVHSPAFFPKPLPIFPCVGCG